MWPLTEKSQILLLVLTSISLIYNFALSSLNNKMNKLLKEALLGWKQTEDALRKSLDEWEKSNNLLNETSIFLNSVTDDLRKRRLSNEKHH